MASSSQALSSLDRTCLSIKEALWRSRDYRLDAEKLVSQVLRTLKGLTRSSVVQALRRLELEGELTWDALQRSPRAQHSAHRPLNKTTLSSGERVCEARMLQRCFYLTAKGRAFFYRSAEDLCSTA
eukprot:gnl/Hemi2/26418_TR8872_c0_g1_i1.p1 gnl/Hemi2/26418_TR8872_c0_g1~~gnl/Hemi2/26418_TR8872_c0_g1_i1.p1  ORF type:complete len:126 (+),score=34.93 gnl/Hemi2/26418_TR8872_c0_g1_i1:127-504(+)